jgi:TolA-binding protein
MIAAEALGSAGDAYVELKDYDKAETYFKKAADKSKNGFLTPIYLKKLGLVLEAANDNSAAVEAYKSIKTDYPESTEAQSIDEYIARAEAKLN